MGSDHDETFARFVIGPLITSASTKPLSETEIHSFPVDPAAWMIGKYSGLAPAMAASFAV